MIWRWTVKSLLKARLRAVGSVSAVAAAFLLITTFKAAWEGESEQLVAYIANTPADVWVMQSHVSNMHMASSFLSEGKRLQIAEVEGVEAVAGILYLNAFVRAGGQQWFSYVVGIDEGTEFGGPWAMSKGRRTPGPGEAIIPEVLARITGAGMGANVQIADKTLTVAGLSTETFSAANPITFVNAADLSALLSLAGYDSYVLVRAKAGVNARALADRIQREVDDVQALSSSVFIQNDRTLAKQMGSEVIGLLTAICAALAAVLVGFSLYIHVSRQNRDLAVLKALGFRNGQVYLSVFLQSALVTGTAFLVSSVLTQLLVAVAPTIAPVLSLKLTAQSLLEIGAAGALVATLASLMVARRITRVDPLSVFQS